MRFIDYTDLHVKGTSPRHRIDNYSLAMIAKLKEVYDVALAENCQFVTFTGDFFDVHRIYNYDVIADCIDIICDSKIPTYSCLGEHDLFCHSPDSFPKSALSFLCRRCGNMKIIREPVHLDGVSLYAKHEWQTLKDAEIREEAPAGNKSILLCHELLTVKKMPFECFLTSEQKLPYDLVLCGDLHSGFPTHKVVNTIYANPGSLCRKAYNEANKRPKILLIDTEPEIVIKEIYLKNVHDPLVAFERVEKEDDESLLPTRDADAFIEAVNKMGKSSEDIFQLVDQMGNMSGIEKDVLKYISGKRSSNV